MHWNERIRKKCNINCECKDTGFVEVHNTSRAGSSLFNVKLKTIVLVCNGPMGDQINAKRPPAKRSPVYDPKTMYLVGEPLPKLQQQMF